MKQNEEGDFLVIGSGIAGLNFALRAAQYGQVAIITKKELMESNSNYAQGGIAVVLDKTDNFKKHIADTIRAGCHLNDKKAVETMVKQAPGEIKRLIDIGVGFAREQNKLSLAKEGGHSRKRIVHAKDATGKEIERALIYQARQNKNIAIFESHLAVDLLVKNNQCFGAIVLNNNKIKIFLSRTTILATGGASQVYLRNSNPKIATGDGLAMAYRAGAKIRNMEFIQFHPTALAKAGQPAFLVSETLRGEGAILKNRKNAAFMKKYHPQAELAPRDVVSRAIFNELKKGSVYLDIRQRGAEFIKNRFPYIYNQLWWYGILMDKDLIPVAPAAHYTCGGVHTNLNGETNIRGLYAVGETAHTGVHGANRLASNSLLECLVFSSRAVKSAVKCAKKQKISKQKIDLPKIISVKSSKNLCNLPDMPDGKSWQAGQCKKNIQSLMWQNVGIIRKKEKMRRTLKILEKYHQDIDKISAKGVNKEIVELQNLCQVARLITRAALARKKSVGSHHLVK